MGAGSLRCTTQPRRIALKWCVCCCMQTQTRTNGNRAMMMTMMIRELTQLMRPRKQAITGLCACCLSMVRFCAQTTRDIAHPYRLPWKKGVLRRLHFYSMLDSATATMRIASCTEGRCFISHAKCLSMLGVLLAAGADVNATNQQG